MDVSKFIPGVFRGMVAFALIAWRENNNYRSRDNYGDLNTIRNSLAGRQWVEDNQIPVCPITESEKLSEMTERQATWEAKRDVAVKNPTDAQAVMELKIFEQVYTEPVDPANPDGERKLIEPIFSGNAGFRRSRAWFGAMVQRATAKPSPTDPEPDHSFHGQIPVRFVEYKNRAARLIDQQLENEMQGVGTVKMSDLDKLRVTHDLYAEGCREVDVRKLYTSSTGQKAFGICRIDSYWPSLKIYNRFFLPSEDNDYIPWGSVRHNEVVALNNRSEVQRKIKEGIPLRESEHGLEPLTQEDVDTYFRDKAAQQRGDGKNANKMMSKDDIGGIAKNHKLLAARFAADSILANTTSNSLQKLIEHHEPVNTITEMVTGDPKVAAMVDAVVPVLKTEPDIMERVAKLLTTGRKTELVAALDAIENPKPAPAPAVETPPAPAVEKQQQNKKDRQGNRVNA